MKQRRPWSVRELLARTTAYFAEKGIPTARLDSEVLLAHALSTDRLGLYLRYERLVPEAVLEVFRSLVRRRAAREPVAYITGEKEFYGLPFRVTRDVLVPRPETELLVEHFVSQGTSSPRVLDVGTGSGVIAVVVAMELPESSVVATDISEAALAVAQENARRHGVLSRIEFRCGNLLNVLQSGETFDAVLANLPYIPTGEFTSLEPEVARYEPRMALDGGEDGLTLIRRLVDRVPDALRPGGWLALEVGAGQAEAVAEQIRRTEAFEPPTRIPDYAGVERFVFAKRRG